MKHPTKAELKKYRRYINKEANKFRLTGLDLHNLYDLTYMINWQDYKTLELNKMDKWFRDFFGKIEDIVLPELAESCGVKTK